MLIDNLSQCIDDMKFAHDLKTGVTDAQNKKDADERYAEQVSQVENEFQTIKLAHDLFGYQVPEDMIDSVKKLLQQLDAMPAAGTNKDDLLISSKAISNMHLRFSNYWKEFYGKKKQEKLNQIAVIQGVAKDKDKLYAIKADIKNAENWKDLLSASNDKTIIQKSYDAMQDADQIISDLDLNDSIIQFLTKTANERATLNDITSEVISWIRKEGLDDKFIIKFSSI